MIYIPPSNLKILSHLNTYRFLTAKQVVDLGVTKHIVSARKLLRWFDGDRPLAIPVQACRISSVRGREHRRLRFRARHSGLSGAGGRRPLAGHFHAAPRLPAVKAALLA